MPSLSTPSRPAPRTTVGEVARPETTLTGFDDSTGDRRRRESTGTMPDPPGDLATTLDPLLSLLTRTSRRILGDDGLADDAIQETLMTFCSQGVRPENPQAWLLRAVTLRSLHLARTCRRRREREKRACIGRTEWSFRDDPARSLDHADLLRLLDESLSRLTDEYRTVFLLWAIEEMDYAGIAQTLQIPIGTVRSRLNRARVAIRETLSEILTEKDPELAAHQQPPDCATRNQSSPARRSGSQL
jgi:RNA polymerase sigma-70 factor (ECF subfamily)